MYFLNKLWGLCDYPRLNFCILLCIFISKKTFNFSDLMIKSKKNPSILWGVGELYKI